MPGRIAGMMVRELLQWLETAPALARADAARSLAESWLSGAFDEDVRRDLEAVLTLLLDDPAPEVRRAMAAALADRREAPRHIVLGLAADQPDIAVMMLARSPVLIDAELVDFVAGGEEIHQVAIASRPRVSNALAAAIAEVGEESACRTLIANP